MKVFNLLFLLLNRPRQSIDFLQQELTAIFDHCGMKSFDVFQVFANGTRKFNGDRFVNVFNA
jgi:hypothetical protein